MANDFNTKAVLTRIKRFDVQSKPPISGEF